MVTLKSIHIYPARSSIGLARSCIVAASRPAPPGTQRKRHVSAQLRHIRTKHSRMCLTVDGTLLDRAVGFYTAYTISRSPLTKPSHRIFPSNCFFFLQTNIKSETSSYSKYFKEQILIQIRDNPL